MPKIFSPWLTACRSTSVSVCFDLSARGPLEVIERLTVPCLQETRSSQGTRICWPGTLKGGRKSVEPGRDPLVYIPATG